MPGEEKVEQDNTESTERDEKDEGQADGQATDRKAGKKEAGSEEMESDDAQEADYSKVTLPKDSLLDDAVLEKIKADAQARGLSVEDTQAIVDGQSEAVSSYAGAQEMAVEQIKNEWLEQSMKDKEIGGDNFKQNVALVDRLVKRFSTPLFRKMVNETGVGNNPEFIRLLLRIGKTMDEDLLVKGGTSGAPGKKSLEELFYGGK